MVVYLTAAVDVTRSIYVDILLSIFASRKQCGQHCANKAQGKCIFFQLLIINLILFVQFCFLSSMYRYEYAQMMWNMKVTAHGAGQQDLLFFISAEYVLRVLCGSWHQWYQYTLCFGLYVLAGVSLERERQPIRVYRTVQQDSYCTRRRQCTERLPIATRGFHAVTEWLYKWSSGHLSIIQLNSPFH